MTPDETPTAELLRFAGDLPVTEEAFQQTVIEFAQWHRWKVMHMRPARTNRGWRTPVQADGAGWPDLTMVRGARLIFAELKSDRGRLSEAQRAWLHALQLVAADSETVEVHVWSPRMWDEIETTLR